MTNKTSAGNEEVDEKDDHEGRYPGGYLIGAQTRGASVECDTRV